MDKKETVNITTAVGMALLVIVTTMSSLAPVLGAGHWNMDEDFAPSTGYVEDRIHSFDTFDNTNLEVEDLEVVDVTYEDISTETTEDANKDVGLEESNDNLISEEILSDAAYDVFQRCLLNITGEPTEQEVQDCLESNYVERERDSNENTPTESTEDINGHGDANTITEHSTPYGSEEENEENENVTDENIEE